MTNTQFQLLDELYFVTSYSDLANASGLSDTELQTELEKMWKTGWLRVFWPDPDTEVAIEAAMPLQRFRESLFLASKAGLLAHNTL